LEQRALLRGARSLVDHMKSSATNPGMIIAVGGPSGCGKSALIDEMLTRFPANLVIMRSLTTRSRRETDDDRATRFVSRPELEELRDAGRLVQSIEYAGNLYGDAIDDVDAIVASGRHGIRYSGRSETDPLGRRETDPLRVE
jgi:guanylate kinase